MQLAAGPVRGYISNFRRTSSAAKNVFSQATARTAQTTRPSVVRVNQSSLQQQQQLYRGLPFTLGSSISSPLSRSSIRSMAAMAAQPVPSTGEELAVLGGGCFWCLEACYQQLKGVSKVVSGYAGGHVDNPTYEQVCGKQTGHAEVVAITYNPNIITFKDLLDVFFTLHDPTTPNRQGADVGPQYRSIILYTNEQQKQVAEQVIAEVTAEKLYPNPIVTEVVPLTKLWPGEQYHQNYYNDNPNQGYCRMVVGPKVAKFRSKYLSKLMATAG